MGITVSDFLKRVQEKPAPIIIDVRDDEKWEDGHIPTAIHIHKSEIAEQVGGVIADKDAEIYCYCGGGQSGPRTAELLKSLGFSHASAIDGGFRSYKASGATIQK